MKVKNLFKWTLMLVLILGMGNYGVAQSKTLKRTKASETKVMKAEQKDQADEELTYKKAKADKQKGKMKAKYKNGKAKGRHKEEHPGKGHAYGKYKSKGGQKVARHKTREIEKEEAEDVNGEKKKIGKAQSKSRKADTTINKSKSRKVLKPKQGN